MGHFVDDRLLCRIIQHLAITTGVIRGNAQLERVKRVIISVPTKLSIEDRRKWYKFIGRKQTAFSSTVLSTIFLTSLEVLTEIRMKNKDNLIGKELFGKVNDRRVQRQWK